jgi:hypothetical protein
MVTKFFKASRNTYFVFRNITKYSKNFLRKNLENRNFEAANTFIQEQLGILVKYNLGGFPLLHISVFFSARLIPRRGPTAKSDERWDKIIYEPPVSAKNQ